MKGINILMGMVLLSICIYGWRIRKKEDRQLSVYGRYLKKHMVYVYILGAVNLLSFLLSFMAESSIYIEKNGYGQEEKQVELVLENAEYSQDYTLSVSPRMLKKEQLEKKMKQAFSELDKGLKGNNASLEHVEEALELQLDSAKYPFEVTCTPADYSLMDEEGNPRNDKKELIEAGYTEEQVQNGILTEVTIGLWYGEDLQEKKYSVCIFPKEKGKTEQIFETVIQKLERTEQQALYDEGITIPVKMGEVGLRRKNPGGLQPATVWIIGFVLVACLLLKEWEEGKQRERNRREELLRSYPWFVNEITLLLGAGMQMKAILYKVAQECGQTGDYRRTLAAEVRQACKDMELGMAEEEVYYRLGRRLKLPSYIKLMTLLEQNVKRGTKGITDMLEQEEMHALEERKNLAKRQGEEISTRLLGPMILLLLIVMLIIMIPAFMSL